MNTAVKIQLTPEEENILKKTIRSRKAPIRLIERSKIIWMASKENCPVAKIKGAGRVQIKPGCVP